MAKKKLIYVAEAADMLGLSERTIRLMCQEGTLRAEKASNGWVIEKTSVKETGKERARALRQQQKKGGKR